MTKKVHFLYASWPERLLAHLIDLLIVVPITLLFLGLTNTTEQGMIVTFLCNLVYFTLPTGSNWQATPGQRLMAVHVVHADGTPLTQGDALERFLAYFIPTLPMYASFIEPKMATALTLWLTAGWFLPIVLREERTGLHDQFCSMRVIAGRPAA